jgi:hypothetical protein
VHHHDAEAGFFPFQKTKKKEDPQEKAEPSIEEKNEEKKR